MKVLYVFIFLVTSLVSFSQNANKILLINGFIHIGNGEVITDGTIGIENNKIILVKNTLGYHPNEKEWDTIIDLQNQHVYPGFVAPNSTLGLTEIEAIRATNDFHEVGELNPHIRALIAFNIESKVISTVRTNGVLLSQATPRGGIISGSSSVFALDGWNWEDAVISKDDGIHINWPNPIKEQQPQTKNNDFTKNEEYAKSINELKLFFQQAKVYQNNTNIVAKDVRLEAMKDIFTGTKRVYLHANHIQQLLDVLDFVKSEGIKFPVIVGGYDSYLCADRIKGANVPIMLLRLHSLPFREEDPLDLPYKLPYLLQKAGVKFCLQNEGDMEAMNSRNLPFLAGTARAYGLSNEEAIRCVSLSACEILGIEKDFGSLEVGKNATLFVSKGDALEMRTNQVNLILINGNFVSTSNFQTELYQKYKRKYQK